jgi:hypothetical protein
MFDKDSNTVIIIENGYQHYAEVEKDDEIQGFLKNFLHLVHQNVRNWNRFMLIKAEIHTLSNDLRRNL